MRIPLSSGRTVRLVFNRDPHPTTRKERRKHRATRVTIAEEHGDHTHLLGHASAKAYQTAGDVFTREEGRWQALVKAVAEAFHAEQLTKAEAFEVLVGYIQRPRPVTTPPKRGACLGDLQHLRVMEQARSKALRTSAA